jgi:hypothetical protein
MLGQFVRFHYFSDSFLFRFRRVDGIAMGVLSAFPVAPLNRSRRER